MANNLVKFYKVASLPATLVPGAIYFVKATQSIHVATATDKSDVFGMGLKGATLENSILTITRHDDTKVTVDFSDIASASSVVTALGTKLNIGTEADAAGTQSYYGLKADIAAAQAAAEGAAKVKDVDTTAANGVNLSVDADGKLDVTVAPGSIAEGDTSVVTGGAVYTAINNAEQAAIEAAVGTTGDEAADITVYGTRKYVDEKVDAVSITGGSNNEALIDVTFDSNTTFDIIVTEKLANAVALAETALQEIVGSNSIEVRGNEIHISEETDRRIRAAKTVVDVKDTGHVTVAVNNGDNGESVVTITESDIASAQDLSGVDKRVENIEKLISEDGDETINNLNEVIAYFNGVKETETGAGLLTTVAGHTSAIEQINKDIEAVETGLGEAFATVNDYTVNGHTIVGNPVLNGADIKLDGYTAGTAAPLAATDTINAALGKLEARVDAAAAGGVQSVGGKAGSITLDTDATGEGNVKFAISEAGEISATVNVGATAAQGAKADTAIQVVDGTGFVSACAGIVDNSVEISVSAFDCPDAGRESEFYTEESMTNDTLITAAAAKGYTDYALSWVEFE